MADKMIPPFIDEISFVFDENYAGSTLHLRVTSEGDVQFEAHNDGLILGDFIKLLKSIEIAMKKKTIDAAVAELQKHDLFCCVTRIGIFANVRPGVGAAIYINEDGCNIDDCDPSSPDELDAWLALGEQAKTIWAEMRNTSVRYTVND